jgi:lipoic acid synthetase
MNPKDVVRDAQSTETYDASAKQKAGAKLSRIPIKVQPGEILKKPDWIRVKAGSPTTRFYEIKDVLRANKLVTVCEEASCPNIGECFGKGTATFMIMGDKCTRRCPFCDVGHGRPDPLDVNEPQNLANTIAALKLNYVVITSVDRDDLRDGGAGHFVECIRRPRAVTPDADRGSGARLPWPRRPRAGNSEGRPARRDEPQPGNHSAPVQGSAPRLRLPVQPEPAQEIQGLVPGHPTKSGLMVGLGETDEEILDVMRDMRAHHIDMLTIGQYLAPSTSAPDREALCAPRHLQDVRGQGLRDGFQARRRGRDGALQLPRRPAGRSRNGPAEGLNHS